MSATAAAPTVSLHRPRAPLPILRASNGPVAFLPDDRKYGLVAVGSQGSGKTSLLMRLILNDIWDPDAAVIVIDPKSELTRLALKLIPPDCGKEVWHLDLARPAFGMTPLRMTGELPFAVEAGAIADNVVAALLDINAGQIFQSSRRYLYHAVIGALAIAHFERKPNQPIKGHLEDVYNLLLPNREDARNAAARACSYIDDLDQTYAFFDKELPGDLTLAASAIAQRLDAPRNKVSGLTGVPSLRRFLNHPTDVQLSEIVKARGVLLVDANMAAVGEENAQAVMHFIFRALHRQMQRQVHLPETERPRVALIADEGHYLVSRNVIKQVATHRAAGLDVAIGLQFLAQLGASEESSAATEEIRQGVLNLLQSRFMFRLGDPKDAEQASRIAMATYMSMIRDDPDSRARMRVPPEMILNLPRYHCLSSVISHGTRAGSFIGQTYPLPHDASNVWADGHLALMEERTGPYPETMASTIRRGYGHIIEPDTVEDQNRLIDAADDGDEMDPPDDAAAALPDMPYDIPVPDNGDDEPAAGEPYEAPLSGEDEKHPAVIDLVAQLITGTTSQGTTSSEPSSPSREEESPEEPVDAPVGEQAAHVPAATPATATDADAAAESGGDAAAPPSPANRARVDIYEPAPLPALDKSPVRGIFGNVPRTSDEAFHQVNEGDEAPPLLRDLALIDRICAVGSSAQFNHPPEKAPRIFDADLAVLKILDRQGLVMQPILGQMVWPDVKPDQWTRRLGKLLKAGLIQRRSIQITDRSSYKGALPAIWELTSHGFKVGQEKGVIHASREYRAAEVGKRDSPGGTRVPHDHHALAWLVQLEQLLGPTVVSDFWRTPRYNIGRFPVPQVGNGHNRRPLQGNDIELPAGQVFYGLTGRDFSEIKPDVTAELRVDAARLRFDLMLEFQHKSNLANYDPKFAAYDAFLTGWCLEVRRYAELKTRPVVVVVATDRKELLELAQRADRNMHAAVGYQGARPKDWYYAGRDHIFFALEEDLHRGRLRAWALPQYPIRVRERLEGDAKLTLQEVHLLPSSMAAAEARRKRNQ